MNESKSKYFFLNTYLIIQFYGGRLCFIYAIKLFSAHHIFWRKQIPNFPDFFNLEKVIQVLFIYLLLFSTIRFSWKYAVRRSMNLTPEAEIKWRKEVD